MADLRTPLCDLLGIRHPILLAGMAGGSTTPELVAAVSEAGGLGVFGATGMSVSALGAAVARARELTRAPVGVNVLVAPPTPPAGDGARLQELLVRYRREIGLPDAPPDPPPPATPLELVEAGLAAGASVVSVGLGDPGVVVPAARRAGVPVVEMASTVADAVRMVAAGADVIVAQGSEAGGHRSLLDPPGEGGVPLVGTMALVPQVVRAVGVPVAAAGGIMDGAGLVAALALGASGVQLGTRFLGTREAGVIPAYRERLRTARDTDTVITTAVSGRPARGLRNRLVEDLERVPGTLGWPRQAAAVSDVRKAAEAAGRADLLPLWAGQAAGMMGDEIGAGEVVLRVLEEARETIARLARAGAAG